MYLWESIMLGSTKYKARAGKLFDGKGGACALGMAMGAAGIRKFVFEHMDTVYETWPWTLQIVEDRPIWCRCPGAEFTYAQLISHFFF